MSLILESKSVIEKEILKLQEEVETLERKPTLAIILAEGFSNASSVYVNNKLKIAKRIGIQTYLYKIEFKDKSEGEFRAELFALIDSLNENEGIDGIIAQLPIPFVSDDEIAERISPLKDVDGFSVQALGEVVRGESLFIPCTPLGAMMLLNHYNLNLTGMNCTVIGRSNILGKPLVNLLINKGATVICCNSKTKNIKEFTKISDFVFLATGNAKMFDESYFKEGATVIDFGMNRDSKNKLCGDLDIESCKDILGAYTPTPGGTGPMTCLALMVNTITAYRNKIK